MNKMIYIGFIALFASVVPLLHLDFYTVSIADLAIIGMLTQAIKGFYTRAEGFAVVRQWSIVFLFMIAASALLSGIVPLCSGRPEQISQYFKTLLHFYYLLLMPFVFIVYPIPERAMENAVKLMLVIGVLLNVFGIYQVFARPFDLPLAWLEFSYSGYNLRSSEVPNTFSQLSLNYGSFFRATSIFSEPSAFASNIVFFLSIQIVPYALGLPQFLRSKGLNITIFVLSMVALLMTFSLTGAVGLAVLIGGLVVVTRSRRLIKIILYAIPCVGVLILADSLIESNLGVSVLDLFGSRFAGIGGLLFGSGAETVSGESFSTRMDFFTGSFEIWLSSPIVGIGLGLTAFNGIVDIGFADTSIMSAISEMGIPGALSLTGLLIGLIVSLVRFAKPGSNLPDNYRRLSGVALFWVLNYTFVTYFTGNILVYYCFWFIIGFAFAVSQAAGKRSGMAKLWIRE